MSDSAAREGSPRALSANLRRTETLAAAAALTLSALVYDARAEAAEPKRTLGLVLCSLVLAACIARPSRFRADARVSVAGVGFIAMSAASLGWGLPAGTRDLGTFVAGFGAALLGVLLGPCSARGAARLAALATGGISGAISLISAARGVLPPALHAGQGNPNWLGLLLSVTLPLSLDALLALRRAPLTVRALAGAAGAVQLPALYLSHSRVAWFAAAVACFGCLLAVRRTLRTRAHALWLVVIASIAFTAYATRSAQDVPLWKALAGRAWIWKTSARAAVEAFPFGAGLGRFGHAYLDEQGAALLALPEKQAARRFLNATTAHHELLQAAVESGLLAAALLALTLFFGVRAALRQRWLGGAAALVACSLTALGDSPLRQPGIALLIGLTLGAPSRALPKRRGRSRVAAGLALALVALLTRDAVRGWLGTRERTAALEGELERRVPRLLRAARLDPGAGETQLELGLAQLHSGDATAAVATLQRADASFADTATRLALGQAELELGRADQAGQSFERALAWNFGSYRAHLGLAEARFRERRLDLAEREASIAHRLLPGAQRARELLDRIREAQMDQR